MRKPGGYVTIVSPEPTALHLDGVRQEIPAGTFESDTFSCAHCNRITHVAPRMDAADMGGLCKVCMGLVCKYCIGKGCDPLEKKLERAEARDRALRSYGF